MALIVSRAMMRPPIAAWIGTSNIWRGISERSFSTSWRPCFCAGQRGMSRESASTGSPLSRISTFTSGAGR